MARKGADQRREASERAEQAASRRFFLELNSISSLRDARAFTERGPLSGDPGGEHYTHLGTFLYWVTTTGHHMPEHLTAAEEEAFCALLDRSDALGELAPGACTRLKAALTGGR